MGDCVAKDWIAVGDVINRRQVQQFVGDLYTSYLVEAVRSDKFYGRPLRSPSHEPMWFARDMRGRTWDR